MKIERNQLAEIIVSDGQPARALINYLQDAMEQLEGFDCITDYYKETDVHPLLNGTPNLKMNNSFFLDFLAMAYGQLREINEKPLKLEDLYMNFSWENSDDEHFLGHGYYLSTSKDGSYKDSRFLIVFNNESEDSVIANINVDYYDTLKFEGLDYQKYKKRCNEHESIYLSVFQDESYKDYKEDEIRFIIPLSKVAY